MREEQLQKKSDQMVTFQDENHKLQEKINSIQRYPYFDCFDINVNESERGGRF